MDDWAESDLAWELADVICPLLADLDRAQLYATIGSGESFTATIHCCKPWRTSVCPYLPSSYPNSPAGSMPTQTAMTHPAYTNCSMPSNHCADVSLLKTFTKDMESPRSCLS